MANRGCLYTKLGRHELGVWFFILIFPAVFIVAGIAGVTIYFKERARIHETLRWTPVDGTIEHVALSSRRSTTLRVIYSYEVDGQRYRSARVASGAMSTAAKIAIAKRYKPGQPVTVYVDPDNPAAAVIERLPGSPLPLIVGILFLFAGAAIARLVMK